MSVNIYWRYKERNRKRLGTDTPSRLLAFLGGQREWGKEQLSYLRGARNTGLEGVGDMVSAIEDGGTIVIETEA